MESATLSPIVAMVNDGRLSLDETVAKVNALTAAAGGAAAPAAAKRQPTALEELLRKQAAAKGAA